MEFEENYEDSEESYEDIDPYPMKPNQKSDIKTSNPGLKTRGMMVLSALMARDKISLIEYSWLVQNHAHMLEELSKYHDKPLGAMQVIVPLLEKK
jgi:hypothetical protein